MTGSPEGFHSASRYLRGADAITRTERTAEWLRYYSPKRIHEQLLQIHMLKDVAVRSVLEVGPYYGLVTAMLDNAGFAVTTLDLGERRFSGPWAHLKMDLTAPDHRLLQGHDCIMCCATLEHIPYADATRAVQAFWASGTRFVVVSVPYEATQLFFQLYLNGHVLRQHFALKKLRAVRRFRYDVAADPYGHKWEVGYRGYPLRRYEAMLRAPGFRIVRRDFSYPCFSVFHLLERPGGGIG